MRRVFRVPFTARVDREVDEEIAFHLDMRVRRLVDTGWSPAAARAEALRQFGDLDTVRDSCVAMDQQRERTMRRVNLVTELVQDTTFALRTLRHNLGYAAVIVIALAVGIGANTAIFTLVDALLVSTLPVKHAEELVGVGDPRRVGGMSIGSPRTDLLSYPLYKDLARENTVFSDMIATGRSSRLDIRIDSAHQELEHARGRFVTGNYFSMLGVPAGAGAGRTFGREVDQSADAAPVATISYGYWTRRFHNDPSIIGKTILINNVRITIVGVAAHGYTGEVVGVYTDIWLPIAISDALNPNRRTLDDRGTAWLLAMGRLKPGATLAQAKQQTSTILQRSIVSHATPLDAKAFLDVKPTYYVGDGSKGFSRIRVTFQAPLLTLMIGVALLLCIICANVANLMLARSIARGRELSVRQALGAGRSRLVRQLLTESAVLALVSAAAGLLFAWWGSRTLLRLASAGQLDIGMNLTVLAFTLGVSLAAVALFGLLPALRASRFDLASSIRSGAQSLSGSLGSRGQRAPLGKLLIASQVTLSVVLLVGATMLARSLRNTQATDIGVDRDHLVIIDVDVLARGYNGPVLARLAHDLRDRIAAIPGIAAVSFSENGVFSGSDNGTSLQVPGFVARSVEDTLIAFDHVGPGYFKAAGTRVLEGRELTAADENRPVQVVVVNESFAKFYFPGTSAIGRFIRADSLSLQIVGVVKDVHQNGIKEDNLRRMYLPYVHTGENGQPGGLRLIARTAGDPSSVVQQIRKTIVSVDPSLPIDGVDPLSGLLARSIAQERLVAQLATAFGVLALLLAAIGLYGLMTYTISRRTREIGLRIALGAQRGRVLRLVMMDAMRLVIVGLVLGVLVAYLSTGLLETQLNGVKPGDPLSILVAAVVLMGSAILAALLPALRASRVEPMVALRSE
jgi:predicted permease